jgi:hypothetical protein
VGRGVAAGARRTGSAGESPPYGIAPFAQAEPVSAVGMLSVVDLLVRVRIQLGGSLVLVWDNLRMLGRATEHFPTCRFGWVVGLTER